jgi:hypothetical protein
MRDSFYKSGRKPHIGGQCTGISINPQNVFTGLFFSRLTGPGKGVHGIYEGLFRILNLIGQRYQRTYDHGQAA